jgi:hypothetical protein
VFESVPSFRSKLHAFRLDWMTFVLSTVFSHFRFLYGSTLPADDYAVALYYIGNIFLVQIFTILIPAWNVRPTKTTWYALMAFENRSYDRTT